MAVAKQCFLIAPIGADGSPTRERSDKVLQFVIAPAAQQCGYDVVRADRLAKPGVITNHVIDLLNDSQLVIADLTERNPNVFYELAIRHVLRKPVIHVIEKGEAIPFDIVTMRAIAFDHRDLRSAYDAQTEIVRQIEALESNPGEVENPISLAFDIRELRRSGNPERETLATIIETLGDVSSALHKLERRVDANNTAMFRTLAATTAAKTAPRYVINPDQLDYLASEALPGLVNANLTETELRQVKDRLRRATTVMKSARGVGKPRPKPAG